MANSNPGETGYSAPRPLFLDMTGYQWTVLFAAWLGWGFDIFDGLLFNYVAPNCVPTLLHLQIGSPEAKAATLQWTGILSSILLLTWAVGGILFGKIADVLGRTRTLLLTMLLYSLGTALCAFVPNMGLLIVCRIIAGLGIGGEWAAGAAMVAEVVPEKRRVEAGALLYTSAPLGLFLATMVEHKITADLFPGIPQTSWRYVFLCGLIPAAVAFVVRMFVKEPERWKEVAAKSAPPRIAELFTPQYLRVTLGGLAMALVALITWWSCNVFIPVVADQLARSVPEFQALDGPKAQQAFIGAWKGDATNWFNVGGLLGTLLTIPASKILGRKVMFGIYFIASAAAIMAAFGLDLAPHQRLFMYFPIGLTIFGVFGSFTYYLPELFPTRLRGTGAGFCYNAGRVIASIGPFLVGQAAAKGAAMTVLFWVGVVPLFGLLILPWVTETKGRNLADYDEIEPSEQKADYPV
jgi:MFS family permease